MKTKNKLIIWIVSLCMGWLILSYIITPMWWSFQDFTDRHYSDRVEATWKAQNRSSKFLINQLESRNWVYRSNAAYILAKRKDESTIDQLIRLLQSSKNENARHSAIGILNVFNDSRVTEAFMKIIKAGRRHPEYLYAVNAFAMRHEDFIYPEILSMAKDNFESSWVVDMIAEFPEKSETLPILEKIAKEDPEFLYRNKAKKAIEKIKSAQERK